MTRTYNKPFGTFDLELSRKEDRVSIAYSINGEKTQYAEKLLDDKKAVVFYTSKTLSINGKKQQVGGVSLPDYDDVKAEYVAIQAEIAAEQASAVEAMLAGKTNVTLKWYEGEYLSAYCVTGNDINLIMRTNAELVKIGAAKNVSGWGTAVDSEIAKALGETFTFPQAVEFMRPANEAREAKIAAKAAELEAKFIEAKNTGKRVLIRSWDSDCHVKGEDCDCDMNYEYAMPDGTTKTEWHHTW